jgi:hypothetical protein
MTVAFMSLLAATITERVGVRIGTALLLPLLAAGAGSVFYWEATHSGADNAGHLLFSNRVAQPDLLLYDAMKTDYASRL